MERKKKRMERNEERGEEGEWNRKREGMNERMNEWEQ